MSWPIDWGKKTNECATGPFLGRRFEAAFTMRENKMASNRTSKTDYRKPSASKKSVRAVADGIGGTIIAVADICAPPAQVFKALTTNEVERWWGHPEFYRQRNWKGDLCVLGAWSVEVEVVNADTVHSSGEYCEIDAPNKLVMTQRCIGNPTLGPREHTMTFRLEPTEGGTRLTLRDEGFIGRSQAAYANADHWELVLGWLDAYLEAESAKQKAKTA
jgi:uncharacterized protein YndB with AHSA1/START domain